MNSNLFFLLYRVLVLPLALGLLAPFLFIFSKKFRAGIILRLQSQGIKPGISDTSPVWIHCASGEFEYAKSVLRELKEKHPRVKTLASYFSPSYKKQIESNPHVDESQILPLDLPGPIRSFIQKHKPQALLIARSDLWPELLKQCQEQNIPTLLFSHTKSSAKPFIKAVEQTLYELLTDIFVVSESDKETMSEITSKPTTIAGDTRYDQVLYRLQNRTPNAKAKIFEGRRYFIAGSTWPEDEENLIEALTHIEDLFSVVLVPHENDESHIHALEKQITAEGLHSQRLSKTDQWLPNHILIVDQMGLLADLYAHCKFAFVGGSFRRKVHSVMEPLGAAKPVIVGPHYKNNREAIEFNRVTISQNIKAVSVAQNAEDLKNLLLQINALQDLQESKTAAIIQSEFAIKTGATKAVLQWLQQKGVL